jgi:hypothetical protein
MDRRAIFESSMLEMVHPSLQKQTRKRKHSHTHERRTRTKIFDDAMNNLLAENDSAHSTASSTHVSEFVVSEKPVYPDYRIHTSYKGNDVPLSKTAFEAANSRGINGLQTRGSRAVAQTQQTVADEQSEWSRALIETGQMGVHSFSVHDLQNNTNQAEGVPDYEIKQAIEHANADIVPLQSRVSDSSSCEEISDNGTSVPVSDIILDCLAEKSVLSGFYGGNSHEVVATTGGQLNMRITQSSQLLKPSSSSGHACLMSFTPDEYANQSDKSFGAFNAAIDLAWHEVFAKHILENTPLSIPEHPGICGGDRMQPTRTYNCVIVSKRVIESFLRTPFTGEMPCIKGDRCQGNMIHTRDRRPLVSFYGLQMAIELDFSKIDEETLPEIKRRFNQEKKQLKMGYCIMCINTNVADAYYTALALGGNKAATRASDATPFPDNHGDFIINSYQVIVGKPGEFHSHDCIASAASPTGLAGFVPKHNLSMYTSVIAIHDNKEPYVKYEMCTKAIPMSTNSVF